jgi:Na+/H+ antiporter NhaD/arsenite permease-like protein
MTLAQILAIVIFLAMFITISLGKVHRYIPALIGAAFMSIVIVLMVESGPHQLWGMLKLPDLTHFGWWFNRGVKEVSRVGGVNWQTIIFIAGMMTMVEGLAAVGFFRWLCLWAAKVVNYRVVPLFIVFMLLSGFVSMFVDSITVLLFLATVTIELARLLKFDPVPMIIAEVFAANTGGSATMAGDPPNIIVGTSLGYTFTDFVINTGPIAWIGMIISVGVFYFLFRKILTSRSSVSPGGPSTQYPEPKEAITNPHLFNIGAAIFILVIVLLITHAQTGISVALIGCIAASLTLIAAGAGAADIIKRVDWRTLVFFIGLFICVGGLEVTGVLKTLADSIGNISGGNNLIVMSAILWISAFASSIVDNIPFAATMVPVITELSATQSLSLRPLAWALSLGTDVGGNGTPIGASANVVGTAIAEKEGYHIGWGRFCKYAYPVMMLVVGIFNVLIIVRYG